MTPMPQQNNPEAVKATRIVLQHNAQRNHALILFAKMRNVFWPRNVATDTAFSRTNTAVIPSVHSVRQLALLAPKSPARSVETTFAIKETHAAMNVAPSVGHQGVLARTFAILTGSFLTLMMMKCPCR